MLCMYCFITFLYYGKKKRHTIIELGVDTMLVEELFIRLSLSRESVLLYSIHNYFLLEPMKLKKMSPATKLNSRTSI